MAHKYRVKRVCYWNLEFFDPEKQSVVTIDTEAFGPPPHHFEPLDGGPVGPTPAAFLGASSEPKPKAAAAPRTFLDAQRSQFSAQPVGAPGKRKRIAPDPAAEAERGDPPAGASLDDPI